MFIVRENSLYLFMPGVFDIKIVENIVYKNLSPSHITAKQLKNDLSNETENVKYKNIIQNSCNLPIIGKYISSALNVHNDGSYEMKYIIGINLMDILNNNHSLCKTAGWDSKEVTVNNDVAIKLYNELICLEHDLNIYSKKYTLTGDWFLHNLVYDIEKNEILNIDLEGFYTYKQPSPMCDLQFYVKNQFNACKDTLIDSIGGEIFSFILWEPCKQFQNDIYDYIKNVSTIIVDKQHIIKDIEKFVYNIYELDVRCHKPYLPKKIEMLSKYDTNIRVLFATIKHPFYDKQNVSQVAVRIKETIRQKYKDMIENYYKDIIIHVSDNPTEAKLIQNILFQI